MTEPVVSVIMAAYNGAALIGETLASLQAQTLRDFELIVVDDGSTDGTAAIVAAFGDPRFRVIVSDVNQGVVGARNRGFAEARGRYIAGLDHDDLCHPPRFARQVAYLDAHPETVLLGTAAANLQEGVVTGGSLVAVSTPMLIEWLLWIENPLVWSSTMMRGDAARQLDPFTRPDRKFAEDFDLYHRVARFGGIARLDEELVTYRRHSGSASQTHRATMTARATDVLSTCHADLFGEEAPARAALVVRHIMAHYPVPDRTTLQRLGETIVRLQDHFIATRAPDKESRKMIRWETAQRWRRIGRIGLRTGAISLSDAIAVRPDHLGLGYAGIDELILSRIVGGTRARRNPARGGAGAVARS